MSFLELKTRNGSRFMIDFATGWEVLDKGADAAVWCNHLQGRNLDCGERYEALRAKLLPVLPVDAALILAVERTRDDLGATGDNYPAVRKLLDFAERAIKADRA
jgi:hypothetical protein